MITIKNDLFLDTIDADLWKDLRFAYTMSTFANTTLRKHVWHLKQALADTLAGADKIDVNPSFWEGLFEDLADTNYKFNFKKGTRQLISKVFSLQHVVGAAMVLVGSISIYALANKIKAKWNKRPAAYDSREREKRANTKAESDAVARINAEEAEAAKLAKR